MYYFEVINKNDKAKRFANTYQGRKEAHDYIDELFDEQGYAEIGAITAGYSRVHTWYQALDQIERYAGPIMNDAPKRLMPIIIQRHNLKNLRSARLATEPLIPDDLDDIEMTLLQNEIVFHVVTRRGIVVCSAPVRNDEIVVPTTLVVSTDLIDGILDVNINTFGIGIDFEHREIAVNRTGKLYHFDEHPLNIPQIPETANSIRHDVYRIGALQGDIPGLNVGLTAYGLVAYHDETGALMTTQAGLYDERYIPMTLLEYDLNTGLDTMAWRDEYFYYIGNSSFFIGLRISDSLPKPVPQLASHFRVFDIAALPEGDSMRHRLLNKAIKSDYFGVSSQSDGGKWWCEVEPTAKAEVFIYLPPRLD